MSEITLLIRTVSVKLGFDSGRAFLGIYTLFNEVELPQRFRIESILVLLDPEQTNRWDTTKQTMIDTHNSTTAN